MSGTTTATDPPGAWSALARLSTACLLGMTSWFSAAAILPQLRVEWGLGVGETAWLTIAVQLGFVVGALASALLNLPDLVPPRRLMLLGCLAASVANGLLAVTGPGMAVALRLLSGVALAFVYPPALKATASWFRVRRGTAFGVMVGALTLGSAFPYLLQAFGGVQWRAVVATVSVLTLAGGCVAECSARDGPYPFPRAVFDPSQIRRVAANRGVLLASLGYFGHMWELYAMWGWVHAFLLDRFLGARVPDPRLLAGLGAFTAIGFGALGCWVAGHMADRWGKANTAAAAMVISGICCLMVGIPGTPLPLLVGITLIWGFAVVADSAQFSALVSEHAEQAYVGTALTLQLSLGFVLSSATLWLVPVIRDVAAWQGAFSLLAIGPMLGIPAVLSARRHRTAGVTPVSS